MSINTVKDLYRRGVFPPLLNQLDVQGSPSPSSDLTDRPPPLKTEGTWLRSVDAEDATVALHQPVPTTPGGFWRPPQNQEYVKELRLRYRHWRLSCRKPQQAKGAARSRYLFDALLAQRQERSDHWIDSPEALHGFLAASSGNSERSSRIQAQDAFPLPNTYEPTEAERALMDHLKKDLRELPLLRLRESTLELRQAALKFSSQVQLSDKMGGFMAKLVSKMQLSRATLYRDPYGEHLERMFRLYRVGPEVQSDDIDTGMELEEFTPDTPQAPEARAEDAGNLGREREHLLRTSVQSYVQTGDGGVKEGESAPVRIRSRDDRKGRVRSRAKADQSVSLELRWYRSSWPDTIALELRRHIAINEQAEDQGEADSAPLNIGRHETSETTTHRDGHQSSAKNSKKGLSQRAKQTLKKAKRARDTANKQPSPWDAGRVVRSNPEESQKLWCWETNFPPYKRGHTDSIPYAKRAVERTFRRYCRPKDGYSLEPEILDEAQRAEVPSGIEEPSASSK